MRPFRLALSSFYSLPTSSSLSSFSSPSSSLFSLSHSTSVIPKTLLNRCSYCYNSSIPFLKQEEKVVETGTPEQADQYLKTLKAGQLISGSKWDYFINEGSTITTDQAYELLTYGRQAKMVTPKRYFSYLLRLAKSGDYIPFHTALSAMERDGVKQTNHMLYRLARAGYKDPNLISRCLCLLSLRSPSIAQLLPELVRLALFTCQAIVKFSPPHEDSKRLLRFFNRTPKKELGTPVYNFVLKFFNDRRDMAMTRAIYDEMVRKNVPRDMRSYEILIRGVDRQGFCQLLQEIKDMNVVLSAVTYTKLMERVCEDREDTMFISALHEMIYHNVPFDLYAYSAAIRGQLKYGHIDEAVGLLKQMLENKIFPDRFIVDLFIDAFKGRPDQIQEMEDMWVQIAIQREAISETAAATPSEVLPVLDEEW